MAASPEFYKPPSTPTRTTSPCGSPLRAPSAVPNEDDYYACRTPTGSYLREPTTCPPAPRKKAPPPCKKRLFQHQQGSDVPIISLRLDELHAIFRPQPPQPAKLEA